MEPSNIRKLARRRPREWTADEQKIIELLTTIVVLRRRADADDLDAHDMVDALDSVLALAGPAEEWLKRMGVEVVDPGR